LVSEENLATLLITWLAWLCEIWACQRENIFGCCGYSWRKQQSWPFSEKFNVDYIVEWLNTKKFCISEQNFL
jgi:hypothetical protein